MRRIVQYPATAHYSEIDIPPQWHQWLRHTRSDPPSLIEQSQDLVRQRNLKVLAAQADARWAARPSFLDVSANRQSLPAIQGDAKTNYRTGGDEIMVHDAVPRAKRNIQGPDGQRYHFSAPIVEEQAHVRERKQDPWKQARGPSEEWQPTGWNGNLQPRGR
jgi:NADH dehydrogenase [ubiquinone] 1 alpha subcomplex assembly factor 2